MNVVSIPKIRDFEAKTAVAKTTHLVDYVSDCGASIV